MIPLLNKLADDTGTPLRNLEMKWRECREAVIEKYGRDKSGTYEYVRTVLAFSREIGVPFSELSL